jgi:AcrR family transcriptional regulator
MGYREDMMNGFERRTELIKEKIKMNVLTMLSTWGPRKIRIADIAAEAGVSQVTIYNYFGSKEALLREVFKDYLDKNITDFEKLIEREPSLREIIQYIVFADKEVYRAFTPEFIKQLLIVDREMEQYIEELYRLKAMPLIIRFIEEGKRRGQISAKVSTPTILTYINMFKEQSETFLNLAQQRGGDDFLEELIHLFFYGISGVEPGDGGESTS